MKFAAASKSELIEEYIVREILPRYRSGEKIPSELELSRELQTSRPTIHKIFSNLTAKGVLYRENGVGTFISAPSMRNRTISVVLSSSSEMSPNNHHSWFNAQFILEGFTRRALQEGVNLSLIYLHPDDQPAEKGAEILLSAHTDHYLFPDLGGYVKLIPSLLRQGKVCIVRAPTPSKLTHAVYGELRHGVRDAVNYLIRSGRKNIAHFGGAQDRTSYELERYSGYEEAMTEAGLPIRPELVRVCDGFPQDAYLEAKKMLAEGVCPEAIFAGTDLRAFGIMDLLNEKGLKIPDDIAIIGSDNLPDCRKSVPPLSSVEYPLQRMGEGMFEIFRQVVANPSSPIINLGFECRFIKRGSC